MGQSFKDSSRYASMHASPTGEGDARPTAVQIIEDNELVGKMQDKVILVTGGSNGIGVEEVRALLKTGARVFFTSRDPIKGEIVRNNILMADKSIDPRQLEIVEVDLKSLESVKAAARAFKSKSDKLNVLVNNAGIAMTPQGYTKDGFEQQFGVNHLAHFYLFQLLKPMLIASSTSTFHSRVIAIASSIHTMGSVQIGDYNLEKSGYNPIVGYHNSKTANIWFANELERRYGRHGLHGVSVHPGGILTGLSNSHDEESRKMVEQYLAMPHIKSRMKTIEQGAASVVLAAVGREYEGVGGFFMEDCGVSSALPDDAPLGMPGYKPWAYDKEGERKLWIDSLEFVGLEDDFK